MADYAENLFEAIQILVDKSIEAVKFDETINVTIVDASNAKNGKYIVSNGTSRFAAYSSETNYKENDAVMVTIPQGNYDNEKIIIGKAIRDSQQPLTYESPFETIINLTNNIIVDSINPISFWANSKVDILTDSSSRDIVKGYAWSQDVPFSQSQTYYKTSENESWPGCIWDSGEVNYLGYSVLGLQAQFSTWLEEYNTISGNYGLMLEITFDDDVGNKQIHSCQLDSDSFFGNIYNFETYYTQEQVFDISQYADMRITRLRLFPYQRCNFKTLDGEDVPVSDESDFSTIPPNIFIKDFLICLGSYKNEVLSDTAELLTESSLTYDKNYTPTSENDPPDRATHNLKILQLRWIHFFEDEIKVVIDNEIPENYEIQWYRAKDGEPSSRDNFAGAHWVRYYGDSENEDNATNRTQVKFNPNINKNSEKIKVVILKRDSDIPQKIATTNIIEFTNNTQIRDNITFEDITALSLVAADNFNGNYFLYDRRGNLGKQEWNTKYCIKAKFNGEDLDISDCSEIIWSIPETNTMIKGYDEIPNEGSNEIYYYINDILNNNATNNTISLKIVKDGLEYAAAITLRFGTAGTNGSNYTMSLIWDSDQKALDVIPAEDLKPLTGTLQVLDQNGAPVDISSATIVLNWAVAADCNLLTDNSSLNNNNYEFEEETEDIYYPVFFNNDNNSLQKINNFFNSNNRRQPLDNEFYFFEDGFYDIANNWNNYYSYDLETKSFIPFSFEESVFYGPVYRKKQSSEENKYKITFKEIKVIDSNSQSGTIVDNSFKTVNNEKVAAYYNYYRRYFIKYDNQFILDPWDGYQENETYYEPILENPSLQDNNNKLQFSVEGQRITIFQSENANFNNLNYIYVLKVTLNNFGDYPLVIYKPIPLTRTDGVNLIVNYVNGPEDVRYATTGETDFNKNPFEIEANVINQQDNTSEIVKYEYREELDNNTIISIEPDNFQGYWRLLIAENYDKWDPAEENNQFYPSLKETVLGLVEISDNNFIQRIKEGEIRQINNRNWLTYYLPILQPPALYYKDAAPYALQFILSNGEAIWTQPIWSYQDNYPSTTLNQWNGKDIITDNDTGAVVANGFAAGHKNTEDNTFSGVVLGDWSRTDTDRSFAATETGIYGFNHGAMSYALKDDGTAFFGKDGRGRIYIDGNNATIKSASWRYDNPLGMMIDLDDGILDTRSQNSQVYISPNSNRLLDIQVTKDGEKKDIFYVGDSSYYLKTANFNDTHDENGHGTKIDLVNGTISSYDLNLTGYKKLKYTSQDLEDYRAAHNNASPSWNVGDIKPDLQSIKIDVNDAYGYPLAIGKPNDRSFLVSWDGRLLLKNSKNEGTNDTPRYISLNCSSRYNNIYPLAIGTTSAEENREFKVGWDGKLYAQGAEISGIISATSGEIGGWKISSNDLTKTTKINDTDINYDKVIISADPAHNWGGYALGIFSHDSNGDHQTLRIKYDGTIIQGSDSEYKFKVEPNGNLTTKAGSVGGWTISSDSISKIKGTGNNQYYTKLLSNPDSDSDKAIIIGKGTTPDFYVQYNGYMYANAGRIGSWYINSGNLQNAAGTVILNPNGTITGGTISGGTISGGTFSGNITATGGTISGAAIRGGSININEGIFEVTSTGQVKITSNSNATYLYLGGVAISNKTITLSDIISLNSLQLNYKYLYVDDDGNLQSANSPPTGKTSVQVAVGIQTQPTLSYTRNGKIIVTGPSGNNAGGGGAIW